MPPKVDVYSIMRDEIVILPYFLRHYETIADRIFVWDDGSVDGTREMLEAHPKVTILPCNLGRSDDVYFIEHLWPQYKQFSRGKADWVICADADEFVYHPDLFERLAYFDTNNVKIIRLCGILMYSEKMPTTSGQIYEEIKHGWIDRWYRKAILFTPDVDMNWAVGRHHCKIPDGVKCMRGTGINLLHYRHLGEQYFLDRCQKNAEHVGPEYATRRGRYNLPNGSRGIPVEWYKNNQDKLIKVVD